LFPNQAFLSGKGFGNLIALPLFKPTFEKGNSCFINPETFESITDQWDFLKNIKRVSTIHLDELYDALKPSVQALKSGVESNTSVVKNGTLSISLNNNVRLSRIGLTPTLIN